MGGMGGRRGHLLPLLGRGLGLLPLGLVGGWEAVALSLRRPRVITLLLVLLVE